jgi:hypothetical protein
MDDRIVDRIDDRINDPPDFWLAALVRVPVKARRTTLADAALLIIALMVMTSLRNHSD